nr:CotH kinase family protein [Muribaculaceae bacterium]
VEITEMEPTDIADEALTGGYFVEVDAYANQEPEGEWLETTTRHIPVTIKSPDPGISQQYNYIKSYFEKVESLVFRYPNSQPGNFDYRNIFDLESFVQHFIVGELSGNTDTYWSTYMYKDRGDDKIHTGPVWDFDIAFDNDARTYPINNITNTFLFNSGKASAATNMMEFAQRIIKTDTRTTTDISDIWSIARNDYYLTYDDLAAYIDAKAAELDASQKLNFIRWPIMNQYVHQNPVISGSYAAEVNRIKTYLRNRFTVLDKLMKYDPSKTSSLDLCIADNTKVNPIVNGQTITITSGTFTVHTLDGRLVFAGTGTTPLLSPGLYIVTTPGAPAVKVVI